MSTGERVSPEVHARVVRAVGRRVGEWLEQQGLTETPFSRFTVDQYECLMTMTWMALEHAWEAEGL